MNKLVAHNLKPIAFVIFSTAVGALFGHALVGFLLAIIIITFATVFL